MVCTVNELYLNMRRRLLDAGISAASLEAREILSFAANIPNKALIKYSGMFLSDETVRAAEALIDRRVAGEPCAYIIGEWDFYSLSFKITPAVLIPRQDTEALIDKIIELVPDKDKNLRILDLCSGSGCIGITLASIYKNSRVALIDNSEAALEISNRNINMHRLDSRVYTYTADALSGWTQNYGMFDIIVSNPPYIKSDDITRLDRSVKEYEPLCALDGGKDGLDFYRAIAYNWTKGLKNNGFVAIECGAGQAEDVSDIFKSTLSDVRTSPDLRGIRRVVTASNIHN